MLFAVRFLKLVNIAFEIRSLSLRTHDSASIELPADTLAVIDTIKQFYTSTSQLITELLFIARSAAGVVLFQHALFGQVCRVLVVLL